MRMTGKRTAKSGIVALALCALGYAHAGPLLTEGSSLEMSFSSLPFIEYVGYQDQGSMGFQ
ncbi:MAG: hypothetical protein PHG21_10365, partial [Azoarcus sp.]|nr:hypothetical protein [Azoarcus sp.]